MDMISIIVGLLAGIVGGGAVVFVVLNAAMKKRSHGILKEAEVEAEALRKEKIFQAKEKFLQLKEEHEKEVRERERALSQSQEKSKQREQQLSRQQQELANQEKLVERIREELKTAKGPARAIELGYERAFSAIADSNITTFMTAAILWFIGTGPVKGFAVTLGLGILTSVFTALFVTRLIIVWWFQRRRPKTIEV